MSSPRKKLAKPPSRKAAKAMRKTTLLIPMGQPQAEVILAAAQAEGESLAEFLYGGICMRVSQDLRILENFLAGFPLDGLEVKRLNQLVSLREAAEKERQQQTKLMTGFLASKLRYHREYMEEQLERALGTAE